MQRVPSALLCLCIALSAGSALGQVSLTTIGSPYLQDFNTLANTGNSSFLPTGWAMAETGTNANATYTAGTGTSNAGDTYSLGAASSIERALGGLLSGSLTPAFGVQFTNNTGATLTGLDVAYVGEMWRMGTLGRVDRLDFQYSFDATSLSTGTWTDVDALDFTAPVTAGTIGALDGNAAANRTATAATISGLSIGNGSSVWFRWNDFNGSGADDALAVDDFSVTPVAAIPEPSTYALLCGLLTLGVTAARRRFGR